MKKIVFIMVLVSTFFFLSACDSDDDDKDGSTTDSEYSVTFSASGSEITYTEGITGEDNTACAEYAADGNLYGLAMENGVASIAEMEGPSLSFTLPSNEPGTYSGDMANCSLKYSTGSKDYVAGTAEGNTAGTLSIELTSFGELGEAVEGTFSATCLNQSDTEDSVTITSGSFKLLRVEGLVGK